MRKINPAIKTEIDILAESVDMARTASKRVLDGCAPNACNVAVRASRSLQGAAMGMIRARLVGNKIAYLESNLDDTGEK